MLGNDEMNEEEDMNMEVPTFSDWASEIFGGPFTKDWLRFSRPIHEIDGYKVYPAKGNKYGLIVVVNTAGVSAKDITVTNSEAKTIRISGKTQVDAIGETNSVDVSLHINIRNDIQKIGHQTIDGFTYVYLLFKPKDEGKRIDAVKTSADEFFEVPAKDAKKEISDGGGKEGE
jgi:hypothetical protein